MMIGKMIRSFILVGAPVDIKRVPTTCHFKSQNGGQTFNTYVKMMVSTFNGLWMFYHLGTLEFHVTSFSHVRIPERSAHVHTLWKLVVWNDPYILIANIDMILHCTSFRTCEFFDKACSMHFSVPIGTKDLVWKNC